MKILFENINFEISKTFSRKIVVFTKPYDFDYSELNFEAKDVINHILLNYVPINSRINIYSFEGRNQLKNQFDIKIDFLTDDFDSNWDEIKKYRLLSGMCNLESKFYKPPF